MKNKWFFTMVISGLPLFAADMDDLLFDATRYANTSEKREAKAVARAELKEHKTKSLRAAMAYVHGDHVGLQVLVMDWVLEWPSEVVVPVLADFIDNEREETRRVAIFLLGFHTAPELADRVLPYLEDDKCRGAAVRTLGKWKIDSARPAMEKILAEGNERQRVVAANALRDLGNPAAIPALVRALNDPVFTVRNTAARALVTFGEMSAGSLDEKIDDAPVVREMKRRILIDGKHASLTNETFTVDGDFFLP